MGKTFRRIDVSWNSCPRNRYLHIPLCTLADGIERSSISNYCFSRSSPWQPILTPGEPQTIELQNAEMLGRWGNLPPRLFFRHWVSLVPIPEAAGQETQQASGPHVDEDRNSPETGPDKEKGRRDERAATERV
jgi:hypothetical protein